MIPGVIMLKIQLFGPTTVITPVGVVGGDALGGAKPRQILEILALSHGTPVAKDHLAELLWDGAPPASYLATLESYVCLLRRRLGLGRGRDSAISTVLHGYVLDRETTVVDLWEFRGEARAGLGTSCPTTSRTLLEDALGRVSGELLASEAYAAWAVRERELFRTELVAAGCRAASHALLVGQTDRAIAAARSAVSADVLAEEAWRLLMRALWGAGRRAEAIRAYAELREHLVVELGTEPSAATVGLFLEILSAHDASAPSLRPDPREEVRLLLGLLRQAVAAVPGVHEPGSDHALARVAAELSTAS
jgi:DNA-binding SARP family transcriptional activator